MGKNVGYSVWHRNVNQGQCSQWYLDQSGLQEWKAQQMVDEMRRATSRTTAQWAMYERDGINPNKDN